MFHNAEQKKSEEKENPFEPRGLAGTIYVMLHDVVCILAAITVCFVFFIRLVEVSGSSMYPTLVGAQEQMATAGDYLLLRSNFLCALYQPGDIVVACVPQYDGGKPLVKRVIACEGQTVSFRTGEDGYLHVWVDDVLQSEQYTNGPMQVQYGSGSNGNAMVVPAGCYFLMGDNRDHSLDSRDPMVGMVDGRYIVGKALGIVFPGQDYLKDDPRTFSRIGTIYD